MLKILGRMSKSRGKSEAIPTTANTVIGEGITFQGGVIKGINSVRIAGIVFGDIDVDGEVIIDETGYVKGTINATFAVIAGIVEGDLKLSSYISITSTGNIQGDISCTSIRIEDGAVFCGHCNTIVKSNSLNKRLRKINESTEPRDKEKNAEKEEKQEPREQTVRETLRKAT